MDNKTQNLGCERTIFRWRPATWLRVRGDDAFTFLQGQLTNDLRRLDAEAQVYGLWLNQKGRVLADSFLMRGAAGEFWVGSYFSPAMVIRERLEAYVIADDVEITDASAEWGGVTLFGFDLAEVRELAGSEGVAFAGRRSRKPSVELLLPVPKWRELVAIDGAREVLPEEMERWRIEAGIPAVPRDLGPGDLPNEGGLDVDAISYSKGCYLGQEVMARLKTMGQVRRRLKRVRGRGVAPLAGAPLFQNGRRVGEMRSAVPEASGFTGLAMMSLLNFQAGAPLCAAEQGEASMEVVEEVS